MARVKVVALAQKAVTHLLVDVNFLEIRVVMKQAWVLAAFEYVHPH